MSDKKLFQRTGKYEFTNIEKQNMLKAIPQRLQQIKAEQSKIASLKASQKTIQTTIDNLSNQNDADSEKLERGWEERLQDCHRRRNWPLRQWEYVNPKTKKVVATEPFTPEDFQVALGEEDIYMPPVGEPFSPPTAEEFDDSAREMEYENEEE